VDVLTSPLGAHERNFKWNQHVRFLQARRALQSEKTRIPQQLRAKTGIAGMCRAAQAIVRADEAKGNGTAVTKPIEFVRRESRLVIDSLAPDCKCRIVEVNVVGFWDSPPLGPQVFA
jgi:hypothetical protein